MAEHAVSEHTTSEGLRRLLKTEKGIVLIVEDDPIVTSVFCDIVESHELVAVSTADGSQALDLFRSCCNVITCIILDYGLPGMHPAQFIARVREVSSGTPIIVSSGYAAEQVEIDMPLSDTTTFLPKPFEPHILSDLIKAAMSESCLKSA